MKLEVESDKFDMLCGTVQMGSVKLEQESTNVEMGEQQAGHVVCQGANGY